MDDFFDRTADVGSDEEEEEFDEETGEPLGASRKSKRANGLDDSSEEEDDDEEEERRIREGFIVDEDEDEEATRERKRERKKRRREEREEDEGLDEEDLDLIGEGTGFTKKQAEQSKFKRLKRGHREDRTVKESRGVEDIFSDDEDGVDGVGAARETGAFGYGDDMDDFIEQDEFPDEEGGGIDEELGVRAPKKFGVPDIEKLKNSGLNEVDLENMRGAFGDGDEFGWALEAEAEHNEEQIDPDKPMELKDIFEPSQLVERFLTDKDNTIRMTDVPERFQLAREPYKEFTGLTDEETAERETEEAKWVSNLMFPRKRLAPSLRQPFEGAVKQVLRFMNVEDYEPPYIFQNRKDYLIHSEQVPASPNPNNLNAPDYEIKAEKLLNQADLWDVLEMDLKFRAFSERRQTVRQSLQKLRENIPDFNDKVFDDLIPLAEAVDDLQDLQDYLNFRYSAELKDATIAEAEASGLQKRARGARSIWDKVRQSPAYHLVRAFGITADQLAINADKSGRRTYTDDPDMRPDDLADTLVRDPDYKTGQDVINAARAMFIEELVMSPRMRRHMRQLYYANLVFDVHRTDKGLKQINEEHPYYEFKYLRSQKIQDFLVDRPETFLRMLKAETEGLVEVRVRLQGERRIREDLQKAIESDNFSEVADAWNVFRREALEVAVAKLHKVISKGVKDNLKNECENKIAGFCREAYTSRLDQAPFKPKGMELGTIPRVLALSNGHGNREDAICWAYLEENGRMLEHGKFLDLRLGDTERPVPIPDPKDISIFVELVERRKPDVIAVSGFSPEARRLYQDIREIVDKAGLRGTPWVDDDDHEVTDPLDVVIANDEVARLYHTSDRAAADLPGLPPLTRYTVALAKYMQAPMKEYAALGRDITSISFDSNQHLVPEEKLLKYLEAAMVDMVNLVGVDVNDAVNDSYVANLLPYVCGLGPRKAAHMIKIINQNGGDIVTREELVGDVDRNKKQAVGPKVWTNCASFLYITYDDSDPSYDYLDNTRIHPEDYDIARKMAADALEMDEEDIKAETDENGNNAVVRKLVKDGEQDKVNDLLLEQYAEQLETKFQQKKRATLETIRAELQNPYEELRRNFTFMSTDEIFTMLTGETRDSLIEGMIIPVSIKRTGSTHVDVRLDCGIEGGISEGEYPEEMANGRIEPKQVWAPHQTIQAKLMFIDRKKLTAQLTLREVEMRNPYKRTFDHGMDEWDDEQEARDKKEAKKITDAGTSRAQRVIKHPLFRPFNSRQAEEFLAGQGRGDCVIRPSSKGPDHLAVTWKIHDNLYQHIDVLELDKENEFSVGKTLKIGGKYSYSDLDELIVLHIKAMAKKVDEMMGDERYQSGSRQQTEQWLTTYTEANPKRSMYAFCLNSKYPGFFYLCFKAGQQAHLSNWPVKVIPNAFELQGNKYPDMRALKNGFKLVFANQGPGGAMNGRR
ncbi:Transcription elongation factor spt6 [Vermiconidia calcicola]|uniref:Transcription elongation factor spt6 n=1 Tax=Vermiconidia calcicola TaxID=1690605 RepID=A0ACC3MCK2_9PEZI|nr:Transcription elongation factor spt6 [Vermiconidia calcicola]